MSKRTDPEKNIVPVDDALLRSWPLPEPSPDGDKEARGQVTVVGGSSETPGAIVLAAVAALRVGAGKLTIATASRVALLVAQSVTESRVIGLKETAQGHFTRSAALTLPKESSALLFGPGMECSKQNLSFLQTALKRFRGCPIVLDAGAMDIVNELPKTRNAKHPSHSKRSEHPSPLVLTPHAGELARLGRQDKSWILKCPEQAPRDAATRWNAVVVLKGSTTVIATPSGCMWRHDGDDVGLATSGSGDVLAGLLVGLVARGAPLHQASVWAVRLHARAGAALASRIGPMGYLAREISEEVPPIMSDLVGATAALMQ